MRRTENVVVVVKIDTDGLLSGVCCVDMRSFLYNTRDGLQATSDGKILCSHQRFALTMMSLRNSHSLMERNAQRAAWRRSFRAALHLGVCLFKSSV